jgi:predicted glycosyltransferase
MKGPIGYYVHHHGDGHRQRALAIAQAAPVPGCYTLIGTGITGKTEDIACLDVADDYGGAIHANRTMGIGESLHYAPHDHDGIRARMATISQWIMREKPALIVVDVSVEVAMLARLTSTPMVYVRLSGNRLDTPHLDAFRAAVGVIAPFHRELDDPEIPIWVSEKTTFIPGLSRSRTCEVASENTVLMVCGKGGNPFDGDDLAAAAAATPEKKWRAIGPVTAAKNLPPNLTVAGWVETADAEIARAGIVIGHAGDGLVSAVIAVGRPFICLPQERPFGEQMVKAGRLQALGAAVVLDSWPPAAAWPALLCQAQNLDSRAIRRLHDPAGATRAATWLKSLVS